MLKIEILYTLAIQKYIALFQIAMKTFLYTDIVNSGSGKHQITNVRYCGFQPTCLGLQLQSQLSPFCFPSSGSPNLSHTFNNTSMKHQKSNAALKRPQNINNRADYITVNTLPQARHTDSRRTPGQLED